MKNSIYKIGFTGLVSIALLFSSCGENKLNVNMDADYADVTFTIPANTETGTTVSIEKNVQNRVDSVLAANNATRSDIKSINLKNLTFEILDGDASSNFRVLESIQAEISDGEYVNYVKVGELPKNPDVESYAVGVPVNSSVNYKTYMGSNTFLLKVSGVTRQPIKRDLTVKARFQFQIETKL